jgi:hypothetical protein
LRQPHCVELAVSISKTKVPKKFSKFSGNLASSETKLGIQGLSSMGQEQGAKVQGSE